MSRATPTPSSQPVPPGPPTPAGPRDEETITELRQRALARVIPSFCHDVNNAISVVHGLSELLARRTSDVDDVRRLQTIVDQAAVAAARVADLGAYALSPEEEREVVDCADVVRRAGDVVNPLFRTTGGELEVRIGQGPFVCRVDERRLLQALGVLLTGPYLQAPGSPPRAEREACRARISLVRTPATVVVRTSFALDPDRRSSDLSAPVAEEARSLGGSYAFRSAGPWCCHRIAFPALS